MIRPQNLEQEIRRATEAIRRVFSVEGDLEEADAEKLQQLLVECVSTVNSRLRHCDDLLRKGLREEALQECEVPRNFLDLVTELDMLEWDAWADYVRQFGIPPQPPLLLDIAAELNKAYAKAQTLDQVLRLHRLHALARSPLAVRLQVLRSIAERDQENPAWREDIKQYEAARLRQVGKELQQCTTEGNVRGAAALRTELESGDWHTPPPASLVERVVSTHLQLVANDARNQLNKLVLQIDAAFASFDVAQGELLRERWDQLAESAQLQVDDELSQSVVRAFEWLDEERAKRQHREDYQHALTDLEAALDEDAVKLSELTRLMAYAERFEEAIPERVLRRYDQRTRSLESADKRRSWSILIIAIFFLTVFAVAASVAVIWLQRVREINGTVATLNSAVEAGNYDQALEIYSTQSALKPFLASNADVQKAVEQAKHKKVEEATRARRFEDHIAAALAQLQSPQWMNVDAAKKELASAVARTEMEKSRHAEASRAVGKVENELQEKEDNDFNNGLKPLLAALEHINDLTVSQVDDTTSLVKQLEKRPKVSPVTKAAAQLDLASRKLEARRRLLIENASLDIALEQIVKSVGRPAAFKTALQEYLRQRSNGERANDFKQGLEVDVDSLVTIDGWNAVAKEWNSIDLADANNQSRAAKVVESIKNDYHHFVGTDKVAALAPYIASLALRTEAERSRDEVFNNSVFSMVMFQRSDGERLYCFQDTIRGNVGSLGKSFSFSRLVDSTDLKKVTRGYAAAKDLISDNIMPSPQKSFKDKVYNVVLKTNATYEAKCCAILKHLLSDDQMDPVLQMQLLQVLTERIVNGSSILQQHLKQLQKKLETDEDLGAQNWLDGSDGAVAKLKGTLRSTLEYLRKSELEPYALYKSQIEPAVDSTVKNTPRLLRFQWVAILIKDEAGHWTCQPKDSYATNVGKFYVYDAKEKKGDPFHQLGELQSGQFMIKLEDAKLNEGRPVFVALPEADKK